jgi:hypothetical protein
LINQTPNNIDFILRVFYGSGSISPFQLEDFYNGVFNLLSEQKSMTTMRFKSFYYDLVVENKLLGFDEYSDHICNKFPNLPELLSLFFESRFFNLPPNFNYFSYKNVPSDSFMAEEVAFGMYLTNPLFCLRKGVQLFMVYTNNNSNQSNTDNLSKVTSLSTQNCRGAFLCHGPGLPGRRTSHCKGAAIKGSGKHLDDK